MLYRVGRAAVDRADHDQLGARLGRHDLRHRAASASTSLRFLLGVGRSRVLSRRRLLPRALVSGRVPHARDRVVHGRDPDVVGGRAARCRGRCCRWTASAAWPAGSGCSSSKGLPVVVPRLRRAAGADRTARGRRLAHRGRARSSCASASRASSAPREDPPPRRRRSRICACSILGGVQFGFLVGSYGVGICAAADPQARQPVESRGRVSDAARRYVVASIGMIVWAGHVDRGGNKVDEPRAGVPRRGDRTRLRGRSRRTSGCRSAWLTVSLVGINAARAASSSRFRCGS